MIRNVIFDFGAVLFEWKPTRIVQTYTDSVFEQEMLLNEVLNHPDWLALDRGTMLMAEVIPKFAARTGFPEARMEDFFEHIQNSLEKISLTESIFYKVLDQGYSLYYLTNMSNAFFDTLNERHPFIAFFKGGIVSGNELVIKPEAEIFELLQARFELDTSESLFIDDNEENINTARSLGCLLYTSDAADERSSVDL
ncbi:HAD family phosphatase, partial [Photobacterium profundum]|uniref:HAD family hydrolase n=1 Tax=Photobacterium profundum TaxID=74109 RepID=UPI003D1027F4